MTTVIDKIEFVCALGPLGEDDPHFRIPVNFNALFESDVVLLNKLLDPQYIPTDEEMLRLHEILGEGNTSCPTHGRSQVGFITTYKIIIAQTFEIDFPEEEDDDRFLSDPG